MSLKGSPINWWKEKRQSSHPAIPTANRPQTAFPWNEDRDRDLSRIVEKALLSTFESNEFKIAIASQVDPAFSRHHEKLAQIKTANLNLESVLQAHVEDLPLALRGIEDHVTGLKIPDYGARFEELVRRNEELERRIDEIQIPDSTEQLNRVLSNQGKFPDHTGQLNTIISNQTKFVKAFESRFTALETRLEDLDRKAGDLSEEVTNADLRSAIRFGEISNELQDRNTTLNNSIWEVQRELGKKTDVLQRRIVGACEEMVKVVRGNSEVLESIKGKVEEEDVMAAIEKVGSKAEFSEKATKRTLASILEKVAVLDTSTLSTQTTKLENIERGMGDFRKEAEAARNLASVSSKFLSANTTKIDTMASAVSKMHLLVESTNELCQEVSETQDSHAESVKEDVEAVRMHVRSLDNMAVAHKRRLSEVSEMVKRTEGAVGKVDEIIGGVEESLKVLPEHKLKLESVEGSIAGMAQDTKPQKKILDDLTSTLAEMRGNIDTTFSSHTDALGTMQQIVSRTASHDGISTALSDLQSSIEKNLSSHHESTRNSTVKAVSELRSHVETALSSHTDSLSNAVSNTASKDGLAAALLELQSSIENKISSHHETTSKSAVDAISEMRENVDIALSSHTDTLSKAMSSAAFQVALSSALAELQSSIEDMISSHHETTSRSTAGAISEMQGNVATTLMSHSESLNTLQSAVSSTMLKDGLATALVELQSSIENKISTSHEATTSKISNISSSLDTHFGTQKDDLSSQISVLSTPISEILTELSSTKTLLNTHHVSTNEEFATTLAAISTSQSSHQESSASTHRLLLDLQESSQDAEILLQIESWAQNSIAQQASGTASLKEMLDLSQFRDEDLRDLVKDLGGKHEHLATFLKAGEMDSKDVMGELGAIKKVLESEERWGEMKEIAKETEGKISSIQVSVQEIRDDTTNDFTKSLAAENAAALVALSESVKGIDAQVQKSESNVMDTMEKALISIEKEVRKASSAAHDDAVGLKSDIGERIATATDILSSEIKTIDLTSVTASVEAIKAEMVVSGTKNEESTRTIGTDVNSKVQDLASEIKSFSNGIEKQLQLNAKALSNLDEFCTDNAVALSKGLLDIRKDVSPMASLIESLAEIRTACQDLPKTADLQKIDDAVSKVSSSSNETHTAVTANGKEVMENIMKLTSALTRIIQGLQTAEKTHDEILAVANSTSSTVVTIKDGLQRVEDGHSTSFAGLKMDIGALDEGIKKGNLELETGLRTELQSVKSAVTSSVEDVKTIIAESTSTQDKIATAAEQSRESLKALLDSSQRHTTTALLDVKDEIRKDIAGVQTTITESRDILNKLASENDKTASEAARVHKETLEALTTSSKETRDAVLISAEKIETTTKSHLDTTKTSIRSEIGDSKSVFSAGVEEVKASIKESRGVLEALTTEANKQMIDMSNGLALDIKTMGKNHEITSNTIKEESKNLSELVVKGSMEMGGAIIAAKEATTLEMRASRNMLEEKIASAERELHLEFSGINIAVSKGFADVASKAGDDHENTLKSLETTALAIREAAETSNADSMGRLSKDIVAGFGKVSIDHKATLEAIQSERKTITTSVEKAEDVILRGVKDMGSSLGQSITKQGEIHKEHAETKSTVLEGMMVDVMNSIKDEAQTFQRSTEHSKLTLEKKIDQAFSNLSTENKTSSKTLDTHISTLSSAIKDEAETTQARVETLHSRVLDEVQKTDTALRSSLTTLRTTLEQNHQTTIEAHSGIISDMQAISATLSQTQSTISGLPPSLKAIDVAVRVNSAAIARVDKAVLESSSQVKSEIHSSSHSLSTQLDDELADTSRRVRGMAEYEIPRLEALVKRQRDAVEVIGGRIIGTSKRFGEMVANVGKGGGGNGSGNGSGSFSGGGNGNGGMGMGSELLGMSGRLRGGSNASSTRSKDSGYRMGPFENSGRM